MGSSTRKIQKRIKKILSDSQSEENKGIENALPKIINETMKK